MHPFPHTYRVRATGAGTGHVKIEHEGVAPILSAPPVEFDGPGDAWSPEGLLVAAVADCFILTFRAVARAAKLEWSSLEVKVAGVLDRENGVTAFVGFDVTAYLRVAPGTDPEQAELALHRAERGCLVSNSLKAAVRLQPHVDFAR